MEQESWLVTGEKTEGQGTGDSCHTDCISVTKLFNQNYNNTCFLAVVFSSSGFVRWFLVQNYLADLLVQNYIAELLRHMPLFYCFVWFIFIIIIILFIFVLFNYYYYFFRDALLY